MLNIITEPNPILRKKSLPIGDVFDAKIHGLIAPMMKIMKRGDGVGLAAPQIGESVRLVVIGLKNENLVIINPKITKKSLLKGWGEEGCLSVPNKYGEVKRHKNIILEYLDEKNNRKTLKAVGLLARVIQHEVDHLDGILFIDKARKIQDIDSLKI